MITGHFQSTEPQGAFITRKYNTRYSMRPESTSCAESKQRSISSEHSEHKFSLVTISRYYFILFCYLLLEGAKVVKSGSVTSTDLCVWEGLFSCSSVSVKVGIDSLNKWPPVSS